MSRASAGPRWLPAVNDCLAHMPEGVRALGAGERLERTALDRALESVREELGANDRGYGSPEDVEREVLGRWESEVVRLARPALPPVVNATGVVIHTNLGRAPLAPEAIAAASTAGLRYTPIEFDLERGERGSRHVHAAALLRLLTGAEDAVVVNNNAAAILLAVDTLAGGGDVVVSRGELIEIGGGFRIHEIVARGGARLVEVGATNKTHAEDYRRAIGSGSVRAVLKVHRSNFSQSGFVADVGLEELCGMAAERGIPVIFDQGTGIVEESAATRGEPTIRGAVAAGATLVCASGDKLLGGPQAGIACGRREWVARLKENPLLRALRVDKMTLAALEATLRLWLADPARVPARAMIEAEPEALKRRAEALLAMLGECARERCRVAPHAGRAGGGTLPDVSLPGWALRVEPAGGSAAELESALRMDATPIVARVAGNAVWIDVRTFLQGDDERVAERLEALLGEGGGA
ncbi:MAG TPA: L-seryl-tRNA(Sec) selenium transferase [Gemmatimonadota bacterium]|nr:L-seryl-tRNA(Sec) selenium transferase [Gemmatimonadota bacterium]